MRLIVRSLRFIVFTAAVLACAAFAFFVWHSPVFEQGEGYELYTGANSSSSILAAGSVWDKLSAGKVCGESVRYAGDCSSRLQERFRATLLFTEEAGGTVNYYLYSPLLGEAVWLNGYAVNLHIAVRGDRTAVGTPLIFGGA